MRFAQCRRSSGRGGADRSPGDALLYVNHADHGVWAWASCALTGNWSNSAATACCWPATALVATPSGCAACCLRCAHALYAGHTGNDGSAIAWANNWARNWLAWAATKATARGLCRKGS
jgi:hypothetical protein